MQKSLKRKVKTWFYHLLLTIQSSCIACNSFWYMKSVKEADF